MTTPNPLAPRLDLRPPPRRRRSGRGKQALLLSLGLGMVGNTGCTAADVAMILQAVSGVIGTVGGAGGGGGAMGQGGMAGNPNTGVNGGGATVSRTGTTAANGNTGTTGTMGQGTVGPANGNTGAGGGLGAQDGNKIPSGTGGGTSTTVLASAFGTQDIAGTTVEDGNAHLNAEERGVALPSRQALDRWVRVDYQGQVAYAKVVDVGPWFTQDAYWSTGSRPEAERRKGESRNGTTENGNRGTFEINGAAIDLTWKTWQDLGISASRSRSMLTPVQWRFADVSEAQQWYASRRLPSPFGNMA